MLHTVFFAQPKNIVLAMIYQTKSVYCVFSDDCFTQESFYSDVSFLSVSEKMKMSISPALGLCRKWKNSLEAKEANPPFISACKVLNGMF